VSESPNHQNQQRKTTTLADDVPKDNLFFISHKWREDIKCNIFRRQLKFSRAGNFLWGTHTSDGNGNLTASQSECAFIDWDICAYPLRRIQRDKGLGGMAVEAVLSKPLSRSDSLLSGINTGILREMPLHYPSIPLNPGDFPRLLLDSAQTEQGI
jgi:hypothetical protein